MRNRDVLKDDVREEVCSGLESVVRGADDAGLDIASPAVQTALINLHASMSRDVLLDQIVGRLDRLVDEMRRDRRGRE